MTIDTTVLRRSVTEGDYADDPRSGAANVWYFMAPQTYARDPLNFGAGIVYFIHGHKGGAQAYKIGMTKYSADVRIKDVQVRGGRIWHYSENLQVAHEIMVDHMRVVELMFHERFRERMVVFPGYGISEWFDIEDKINGIQKCLSIYVHDALTKLSESEDIRKWWTGMSIKDRRNVAKSLWSDAKYVFVV